MLKYAALTEHLSKVQQSQYPMTFAELETVIQDRLPPSAFKHRAWWSNNPNNSVMTKAWLDAGWISSDVDMEKKRLVFKRAKKPTMQAAISPRGENSNPNATDPGSQNYTLTIRNIDEATMQILAAKARLTEETVEKIAKKIIEQGAHLTIADRLAIADKIRSESPKLHDIDVVALIREDRDTR